MTPNPYPRGTLAHDSHELTAAARRLVEALARPLARFAERVLEMRDEGPTTVPEESDERHARHGVDGMDPDCPLCPGRDAPLRERSLASLHGYDCWAEDAAGEKDHDQCWQIVDAVLAPVLPLLPAERERAAAVCVSPTTGDALPYSERVWLMAPSTPWTLDLIRAAWTDDEAVEAAERALRDEVDPSAIADALLAYCDERDRLAGLRTALVDEVIDEAIAPPHRCGPDVAVGIEWACQPTPCDRPDECPLRDL